ncbi:MAG TPA: metalloregulator ArsR/SmtB family transcription factor [Gemmata sp.]|jgi:DNA-binding transcriptional ArsR family regulator|nr:metalloregulator ArsR/SmtB family transcription factor [Gemmata sp.]
MTTPTDLDETLLALADPTRRAILHRLTEGEVRVTDLAEPFDMSLNAVSKHIQLLERARLVRRRKSGREHLLSLNPEPLEAAAKWMAEQRALWIVRLAALDALLQAEEPCTPGKKGTT